MSKLEKGGLQNLCVYGNATLQCYLTRLWLHHQNKLSSVHSSFLMWRYFELNVKVMLFCKFFPSRSLQIVLEATSSQNLPQSVLGEKATTPKNIKGKIQELEDLCGLSFWSHQSSTFLATLLRRISRTYSTSSSHINILVIWVLLFHTVVKDGYLGTWVLVRFQIEACRRQGRPRISLGLAWVDKCFCYVFTTLIAQPAFVCARSLTCGLFA